MNFLNPLLLFGLLAVAVPIIIHLINLRRPQKIAFSTLAFFKELQKSTIRRIRIKQYLLMALRAAALLFLALALARPFLPPTISGTSGSDDPKAIAIIIDNSPSMERIGSDGPLIEQARQVARELIDTGLPSNRYYIAGTNGESREGGKFSSGAQAKEIVEKLDVSEAAHYTQESIRLAYQQLQQSALSQAVIFFISDGQASQLSSLEDLALSTGTTEKPVSFQMVALNSGSQQNLAVSDIELKSQMISVGSPVKLGVKVENVGQTAAANQFISLEVEGEMSGQYELSLKAGEEREFQFDLVPEKTGDIAGSIILEGDEIVYDNRRNFVIRVPESRSVLLVNESEGQSDFVSYLRPALEAARQTNAQINFDEKTVPEVDQSSWLNSDAIILDGLQKIPEYWFEDLQRFVQNGNGVLFLPSEQGDVRNYDAFFSQFNAGTFDDITGEYASFRTIGTLGKLEEGHPIINELFNRQENEEINIDFPELFFYYHYKTATNTGSYTILRAANDDPLLTEQQFGEGILLISSLGADPGWSNFPVHPLFAPVYYRSILYASTSESGGIQQHVLGKPFVWNGNIEGEEVTLNINDIEVKPDVRRRPGGIRVEYEGKEWQPGFLTINAENSERLIAVNQNIMESRFETLDYQKLQSWLGDYLAVNNVIDTRDVSAEELTKQLQSAGFGQEIWNWFIWIALLFLISETAVSKWYKAGSN